MAHNESYRRVIPSYMLRHKVKPGITGWAQVNGWRGETPEVSLMKKRVEHDFEYIGRWTLLWDIEIILMTMVGRKRESKRLLAPAPCTRMLPSWHASRHRDWTR